MLRERQRVRSFVLAILRTPPPRVAFLLVHAFDRLLRSSLPRIHPPKYLFRAFTPTRRANERGSERERERGANLIPCLSCPSLPSCRRPQDGGGKRPLSLHMPPTDHITYFLMSLKEGQSLQKGRGSLRGRGREYEFSIDADLANQWERNAEIYFTLLREHGACLLPIPSCLVIPPPFRLHR